MLIVLIIVAALCVVSMVCYEVSNKLLQEKTVERSNIKVRLKKKSKKWYDKELKKLKAKSKSKPKPNDEFNVGYAFETIELIEEERNQFAALENEIEDLTDTIHLLRKIKKISYTMVFVCSILLVVVILLGAVAYVLTVKAGAR
jgi:hypothetical protein